MAVAGNPALVGGALALDFGNTAAGRETAAPAEHLLAVSDLIDWAVRAGGLAADSAERIRSQMAADAAGSQRLLHRARQLRETVYRIGTALAGDSRPANDDLQALQAMAQRTLGEAVMRRMTDGYRFDFSEAPAEAAILGPLAWSAVELLAAGDFRRLKQCANPACGWLFLDHSKNNSRRWCDMATCGNVAKARRHRQRHAPDGPVVSPRISPGTLRR